MLCRGGRKLHWYLTLCAEKQRKFHAPKIAATYSEAVDMLLSNHVLPLGQHDDARAFREKHLYFEEVDLVYRQYLPQIDALFDKFSGRFTLPGDEPWMSFQEYMDMVIVSGLTSEEGFSKTAARPCFVNAMMVVENELTTTAHKQMTRVEYYEAVSSARRCCHRPTVAF